RGSEYLTPGLLAVYKRIEVIAADAAQNAREAAVDLVGVVDRDLPHAPVQGAEEGVFILALPVGGAEVIRRAVAQEHGQLADMVDGFAVDDGMRAGGVVADHAAEVGPAGGGDVGAELQVVRSEGAVELIENDAGLHADRAAGRVDVENLVEV